MSGPDFDRMPKDDVVSWFDASDDISPVLATLMPVSEQVVRPATDGPMALISIRLPVAMVEEFDSLADLQRVRRSDVIREALSAYIAAQNAQVRPDEAERALDVLRRVVAGRLGKPAEAA